MPPVPPPVPTSLNRMESQFFYLEIFCRAEHDQYDCRLRHCWTHQSCKAQFRRRTCVESNPIIKSGTQTRQKLDTSASLIKTSNLCRASVRFNRTIVSTPYNEITSVSRSHHVYNGSSWRAKYSAKYACPMCLCINKSRTKTQID